MTWYEGFYTFLLSEHDHGGGGDHQVKIFSDLELGQQVDPVMETDDVNKDGYIDYPEFVMSQQKVRVSVSTL